MRAVADDLRRRIEAARPRDTVRGLVFNATFALVAELAGAPAACATDPAGQGRRREYYSYPVADYLRVAQAALAVLEPKLGPPERVLWELGSRCAMRWFASPLGRVMSAIGGGDVRRAISSAPVAYRSVVRSASPTVEWVGERQARLVFDRDLLLPSFHAGALTRVLLDLAGVHAQAEAREEGILGAVVDVRW
jgi:uncharacterized protein (TIGR02265 family)